MGRIMALDYGDATVGVALSDPEKIIASPRETIKRSRENALRGTFRRIEELVKEEDVEQIVIGYPLNMDGSRGERALKTEAFREQLAYRLSEACASGELTIHLWDERLTTTAADEVLKKSGIPLEDRKKYVDSVAASFILESFMNDMGVKE